MICDLHVSNDYDFRDIPGSESWIRFSEISDGDSKDRKFYVKNDQRQRFFLRIADRTAYDRKKNEYELLKTVHDSGAPVPDPVGFGLCNQGRSLYLQTRWIYGNRGTGELQSLSKYQQYALGTDAGLCLKMIHSCKIPPRSQTWELRQGQRLRKIQDTCSHFRRLSAAEQKLINVLDNGSALLANRPLTLLHGGFHTDNIILSYEFSFSLIDFENWQYGDPLADLANVLTGIRQVNLPYAIGILDCYFTYQIKDEHLMLIRLYAAMDLAERLIAARGKTADKTEFEQVNTQIQIFNQDFQNGKSICPSWYKRMRISAKALAFQHDEA